MSSVPIRLGGATYPLSGSQENSILRDADPAIFYILDFFEWAIGFYIGERWGVQVNAARLRNAPRPVMYATPIDPAPYLTEEHFKFPLLAVYRPSTETSDWSIPIRLDKSTIRADWILPPLTAGQAEQLVPFLRAVTGILNQLCDNGCDEDYTPPGGAAGDCFCDKAQAGIDKLEMVEATYGLYEGAGEQAFHCVSMRFVTNETIDNGDVSTVLENFEGADGTIKNVASDLDANGFDNELAVTDMTADVEHD